MYGINNMKESADKICATIRDQPVQDAVVVLAHNGPSGFGSQQHDICGKDWSDKAGEFHLQPTPAQPVIWWRVYRIFDMPCQYDGRHKATS